jgi:hypothetical protein
MPIYRRSRRRAFTLLEVMIATAVTLLMMLSLAKIFAIIGDSMKQGRAGMELNNRLRSITYRLRQDLDNLTIRVHPPADGRNGTGYLEYFDGAMTDYTCMLFDPLNGMDSRVATDRVRSSRFGDMDDILMFTARAGDAWYTGIVPAAVVDASLVGTPAGLLPVTITSQHAEIVIFARPVDSDPTDTIPFDDFDANGLPDAYQLHYRTLLIRPDLNNASGVLPGLNVAGTSPLAMAPLHQICDLSIRRVYNGTAGPHSVAANSLEDLMNPANRFAHFEYRIADTASSTMPLLVLDPDSSRAMPVFTAALPLPAGSNPQAPRPLLSDPNPDTAIANPLHFARGNFLNAAFVLGGDRLGEDVLGTEILAFDVRGYDAGVPLIALFGGDGMAGSAGAAGLGADGSDDVVVTPADPGYGPALAAVGTQANVFGYGAYVDLLWGRKTLSSLSYYGMAVGDIPATPSLATELSGLTPQRDFTLALSRSGKLWQPTGAVEPPAFLQPTFDTWTTRYEGDGILQAQFGPSDAAMFPGVVQVDRWRNRFDTNMSTDLPADGSGNVRPQWRRASIDAGFDGLDNDGVLGPDDAGERETSPPFPVALRGLRVSVRMEDRGTRQVKQMSVATEFVSQ